MSNDSNTPQPRPCQAQTIRNLMEQVLAKDVDAGSGATVNATFNNASKSYSDVTPASDSNVGDSTDVALNRVDTLEDSATTHSSDVNDTSSSADVNPTPEDNVENSTDAEVVSGSNLENHTALADTGRVDATLSPQAQCQRSKSEIVGRLRVEDKLVVLPLNGKAPFTLPATDHPVSWGTGAAPLNDSVISDHIANEGENGNLGVVLHGQHIVIDGDMKWYPAWEDGGVFDEDSSGKYKIRRFNPTNRTIKKDKLAPVGIVSDYCVDMAAVVLNRWGLSAIQTATNTQGGGRHIHLLAPEEVDVRRLAKHIQEFKFKNEVGEEGDALEFLKEGNYVLTAGVTKYDDGSRRYHTQPNGIAPLLKSNMPIATRPMIEALTTANATLGKGNAQIASGGAHLVCAASGFAHLDDPNAPVMTSEEMGSLGVNIYPEKTEEQVRLILIKVKGYDDRDKWIDVGYAVKHWANNSDGDMDAIGFKLYDEWSKQSESSYGQTPTTWNSLKPRINDPFTLGSLISEIEGSCTPDELALIKYTDPERIKWAKPLPIETQIPEVEVMREEMIPEFLRPWLSDVSCRMQTPADFVSVSAITVFSSIIGAGCGIRPKAVDDWEIIPNLWGACIGRPSVAMKTPNMGEVMRLLDKLQAKYTDKYAEESLAADVKATMTEISLKNIRAEMGKLDKTSRAGPGKASEGGRAVMSLQGQDNLGVLQAEYTQLNEDAEANKVTRRIFKTNEVSTQSMTALQNDNPHGVLFYRDELPGLLTKWNQEDHAEERGYFLEGWNGNGSYTDVKIGRGTTSVSNICISLLGGIQPDRLRGYLTQAKRGSNDGLLQRLQLAVYPDETKDWAYIDRKPAIEDKEKAYKVMEYLADADFIALGATQDDGDDRPYFRFDDDGQGIFIDWFTELRDVKESYSDNPFMFEHLGKFDSLMPSLALIFHLLEQGRRKTAETPDKGTYGGVSAASATLAIEWCNYLESHARRIYGMASTSDHEAAVSLATKIKTKKLPNPFTARQIQQKGWLGVDEGEAIREALIILAENNWILEVEKPYSGTGRRPAPEYFVNPEVASIGV